MPNPLAFPTSALPLVGQPLKIAGYTVIVTAVCQCGQSTPLQLMAMISETNPPQRTRADCPKCRRGYAIQQMATDANGALTFGIEVFPATLVS